MEESKNHSHSSISVVSLKLKLKNWEREFLKTNGRKATSGDVKSSPAEIQALYTQYATLKYRAQEEREPAAQKHSHDSGRGTEPGDAVGQKHSCKSGHGAQEEREPTARMRPPQPEDDGVFGKSLNKVPKTKNSLAMPKRKSIWRLPPPHAKLRMHSSKVSTATRQPSVKQSHTFQPKGTPLGASLTPTSPAVTAKPSLRAGQFPPPGPSSGPYAGSSHLTPGSSHLTPGSSHLTPGSSHLTPDLTAGSSHFTAGSSHPTSNSSHPTPDSSHPTSNSSHLNGGSSRQIAGSSSIPTSSSHPPTDSSPSPLTPLNSSQQPATPSNSHHPTSPFALPADAPFTITASQCQAKATGQRRFRGVSEAWLARCAPDLTTVGEPVLSDTPSPKMPAYAGLAGGDGLLSRLDGEITRKQDAQVSVGQRNGEGQNSVEDVLARMMSLEKKKEVETFAVGKGSSGRRAGRRETTVDDIEAAIDHMETAEMEHLETRMGSDHDAGTGMGPGGDEAIGMECDNAGAMELCNSFGSGMKSVSEDAGMELEHGVSEAMSPVTSCEEEEAEEEKEESGIVKQRGKRQKPPPKQDPPPTGAKAVSENFVRLNLKVKRYSKRPGRSLTGSAYKRQEWKKRQKGEEGKRSRGGGKFVCFKCGKNGHWARNCRERGGTSNLGSFSGQKVGFSESMALGLQDDLDDEMLETLAKESPFPSVSEVAKMVATGTASRGGDDDDDGDTPYVPPPISHSPPPAPPTVEPLFSTEDGKVTATPTSVFAGLRKLGFTEFRARQEAAVMRILCGLSTLLITTTGSGKSLCYQLPAFLYSQSRHPCITLVISPLLSLMDDQVRQFPKGVKGACLHTNQTHPQTEKVLREVVEGNVDVLLLSPEALVGGTLWSRKKYAHSLHDLPPVAFACIDEAHCISEWSHNFRPSYLRLYKVLRERLGVHCVLGLTATATHTTELSIAQHLGVAEENILRGSTVPDNLHISVSCDRDRDQALVELLSREPFKSLGSIIIYCTRQQTTETLAQMLRTCMQSWNQNETSDESHSKTSATRGYKKKRAKVVHAAECYHAGMAAAQRKSVQNKFMSGSLRIVVATVAFGMGLNKADVRAIIHYNLPKSFESFVQEIGRAGRDGDPAYCHVFIDVEGSDLFELRRHAYSNSVDSYAVKKLVEQAFPVCQCKSPGPEVPTSGGGHEVSPRVCRGHEVAIPVDATVQSLDAKEECLSTLLCYMELQGWLHVKNHTYDTCTLKCFGGKHQLQALARKVPAVAAAAARLREKGMDLVKSNQMTFSVIEVARSMGWESHVMRSELTALQFSDQATSNAPKDFRSTVSLAIDGLAFHLVSPGDLSAEEREAIIQMLISKIADQEKREVEKLHLLHAVLKSVATETHDAEGCIDVEVNARSVTERGPELRLKAIIQQYFSVEGLASEDLMEHGVEVTSPSVQLSQEEEDQIGHDVVTMVTRFSDQTFTGRAIARVFHGIASPQFPALVWGVQRGFWRRYLHVDFDRLCHLATSKLLQLR